VDVCISICLAYLGGEVDCTFVYVDSDLVECCVYPAVYRVLSYCIPRLSKVALLHYIDYLCTLGDLVAVVCTASCFDLVALMTEVDAAS
jgi:hypothetical protein